MNDYRNTYRYYDALLESTNVNRDIDIYLNYVRDGFRVLDVGCGTGRLALEIARKRRDCRVDALDISEQMLAAFKCKLDQEPSSQADAINLIRADLRAFEASGLYDLIVFPFQTFQVVMGKNSQVECLRRYRNALEPGGKMIVSLFDPRVRGTNAGVPFAFLGGFVRLQGNEWLFKTVENAVWDEERKTYRFTDKILIGDDEGLIVGELRDDFEVAFYDYGIAREVIRCAGLDVEKEMLNPFQFYYDRSTDVRDMIFVVK